MTRADLWWPWGDVAARSGSATLLQLERLALALLLGWPFVGCFRLLRLTPLRYLALYGLVSLAWLVVVLVRARVERRALPSPSWWHASLLGCGLWMALATAVGDAQSASDGLPAFAGLWTWETGILLALYASHAYRRTYGPRFVLCFAVAVLAGEAAVCLVQYYALAGDILGTSFLARAMNLAGIPQMVGIGVAGVRLPRALGTFYHANGVGVAIVLMLPFALSGLRRAWDARHQAAALGLLSVVAVSVAILLRNVSRTSIVVGVAMLATMFWLDRGRGRDSSPVQRRRVPLRWVLPLGLLSLAAGGSYVAHDLAQDGSLTRAARARFADTDTALVRLGLVTSAINALPKRPLLGYGYAQGTMAMPRVGTIADEVSDSAAKRYQGVGWKQLPAHDLYLMMALDGGLPALLLFLVAAGGAGLAALRSWRSLSLEDASLAVSVGGGFVMALTEPLLYDLFWPFLLFLLGSLRAVTLEPGGA